MGDSVSRLEYLEHRWPGEGVRDPGPRHGAFVLSKMRSQQLGIAVHRVPIIYMGDVTAFSMGYYHYYNIL